MTNITLPERCDRAAVEALWPEFVASMGAGAVEIDATGVGQAGQALLQLLVSARRSGIAATIKPSPALLDVAQLAGLSSELFEEPGL